MQLDETFQTDSISKAILSDSFHHCTFYKIVAEEKGQSGNTERLYRTREERQEGQLAKLETIAGRRIERKRHVRGRRVTLHNLLQGQEYILLHYLSSLAITSLEGSRAYLGHWLHVEQFWHKFLGHRSSEK